jgi:hypothetical protein
MLTVEELRKLGPEDLAREVAKTSVVNINVVGSAPGVCYDTYIGRPSVWGNPYKKGPDGTLSQVLAKYEDHVESSPELVESLWELIGHRLACFCAPRGCHGDVLVRLIEKHCKATQTHTQAG